MVVFVVKFENMNPAGAGIFAWGVHVLVHEIVKVGKVRVDKVRVSITQMSNQVVIRPFGSLRVSHSVSKGCFDNTRLILLESDASLGQNKNSAQNGDSTRNDDP